MSDVAQPERSQHAGDWPAARSATLDWLINQTQDERFVDNILVGFCERLQACGIPVARVTLHLQILHPQWFGARVLWRTGMTEADLQTYPHADIATESFVNSPMKAIFDGLPEIRRRLDPDAQQDYAICTELGHEGLTDYVAWPLLFTLGKRHIISFAADRPGGFTADELAWIKDLLPVLALVFEIRMKNRLARTLLETYVGPHASGQILSGSIARGSGATVSAVVLICDLRGFTSISEMWPRDDVIALLNEYFDAMSGPIEAHGGEILKFIGDGMLAIFPLSKPDACASAMQAAAEARDAMAALNVVRRGRGQEPLGYGVGIHVGDVMYGNIGSRNRLDFTVIGPAVNVSARIEGLTKLVRRNVLFSAAFVEQLGSEAGLQPIGSFPLRGVEAPIEIFAFADAQAVAEQSAASAA